MPRPVGCTLASMSEGMSNDAGGVRMTDTLSAYYQDLLDGTYDCVDRIVLNGYHTLCSSPGGCRLWWRRLKEGAEDQLDNAPLMRLAGRFSRRVHAFADAHGVPIVDCRRGERKHIIAELRSSWPHTPTPTASS
jgi:hypothetical protein